MRIPFLDGMSSANLKIEFYSMAEMFKMLLMMSSLVKSKKYILHFDPDNILDVSPTDNFGWLHITQFTH